MEARLSRAALIFAAAFSLGASHRTTNFIVTAPSAPFAQQIATAAEKYRHDLAMEWLGKSLPRWPQPCPIVVHVGPNLGAGGATSFMFRQGRPFGWQMSIQGTPQRILDSVLPHEVTHTIFATHFGRPLPRWADEGACTTVEHSSERQRQQDMLIEFLTTERGIPFNRMFAMTEYPPDVLPLYAQGYSLARYLIAQGGKPKFVQYVGYGMRTGNWPEATRHHYGYKDLSDLQVTWLGWVRKGSPLQPDTTLVATTQPALGSQQSVAIARASGQDDGGRGRLSSASLMKSDASIQLVPVPASGRSLAASDGPSGQPHPHNNSPAGDFMLALATGTPAAPPSSDRRVGATVLTRASDEQGSWYARQRDRGVARDHAGSSDPDARLASATPRGISPGPPLPGSTSPTEMSRPQATQQMQPQVLQWDQSPTASPWRPHAISPTGRGRPLHAGGTVWR